MKRDACIGRTRGGKNTKIHALVNREGIPVCLSMSAGNCSDCDEAIPLLQQFGKINGSNILGDRAYGAKKIRLYLTERGARYTIPPTKNLLHPWKYDRQTYKRRNVIERCFCRLKDLLSFSPFCTYELTFRIHPSCGARLSPFDIAELREITAYDELELDTLGDRKTALFLIMSDTDSTFNFLISMVYTQLFNLLCEKADDVYGGRLPVHVRCLIDECANIGQIPNLEKLVATIRSREISACLVLQAQSQLKALYKDNADTIIGNMDSQIFLGGSENTTLKELSATLGRETIDLYNTSDTRGNSPSYGTSYQKTGHELMSRDELAVMDGGKCILQLRGVRPFLSDKYDLTQHPNYKLTGDYDKRNLFDIEKFLDRRLKLKPSDVYDVVDADEL